MMFQTPTHNVLTMPPRKLNSQMLPQRADWKAPRPPLLRTHERRPPQAQAGGGKSNTSFPQAELTARFEVSGEAGAGGGNISGACLFAAGNFLPGKAHPSPETNAGPCAERTTPRKGK